MIFLIAIWGSRYRRIKAIFYFFIYTFAGSLLMLFGLIIIYYKIGNTNFLILSFQVWDFWLEKILWVFFFFSFAIKIPMFPFHIWLPEAHVEAPTFGSILLAALLLKLGGFGFFKILIPFFFHGCLFFLPFIYSLCFLGLLYSSLILLCQIDLKKIIAYSSIAHMNYALLGLFCLNFEAIQGSLFLMISHAFTSGALFFLVGFLYEKLHTRLIFYYHGLVNLMPIFCFFFFFFIFSNFGFPGTANFIGEFLILLNFFNFNNNVFFFLLFSLFLSLIYSILLYIKIFFGELFIFNFFVQNYIDLKKKDFFVLLPLCFFNIFFGIFPNFIFNLLTFNVSLVCCL
jgi:NADH-quinone oxidoreductase subunit M